jgi:hypothetical protein
MSKQTGASAWRSCADAQRWLNEPGRQPPDAPAATCRTTADRPHLDGLFDEPLWQQAATIAVPPIAPGSARGSAVGVTDGRRPSVVASAGSGDARTTGESILQPATNPPTEPGANAATTVRILRDDEYLYLAIACKKQPGVQYTTSDAPRPRDAELALHDRVALRIDIDRDYTTAYELAVDHRGWMHDRCWGDIHWNPSWFVAAAHTDGEWTIEAAIPLRELAEVPLLPRTAWALAIERATPGQGTQSWAGVDSAATSPARFGLLLFE